MAILESAIPVKRDVQKQNVKPVRSRLAKPETAKLNVR